MKFVKLILLITWCLLIQPVAYATGPSVPSKIAFADMKLIITEKAREKIEAKVNELIRHPKSFQLLLDRVNLFFPIIERILREEELPEDFKYLVIQESSLIGDAVSTSNAVGYWQFKLPTAQEVGLQVNRQVDERMNIVAATRGAAKYLKLNNLYFDNWMWALLAYYSGKRGAAQIISKQYYKRKKMKIEEDTHWYVLQFLAYKIAFERVVGKAKHPTLCLCEYEEANGKTLHEVAQELGIEESLVREYNKWLKEGRVPGDKMYTVIVPMTYQQYASITTVSQQPVLATATTAQHALNKTTSSLVKVNKIPAIIAGKDDDLQALAKAGRVSLARFLEFNDIDSTHQVIPGQVYYLKKKKSKAPIHYHVVQPGETLWHIAQKYGIKKKKLLRKNRIHKEIPLKPGYVLWMRWIRPANRPATYRALQETVLEDILIEESSS